MYFLGLGIVLLLLKWQEIGPVATWSWWVVMAPFALAVAWWSWADWSGYTKRKAMEKDDERKRARIERQRASMGLKPKPGQRRR